MIHANCAKKAGAHSCRFSSVVICFCVGLLDKLKKRMYECVQKVFNLPSVGTLSHYNSIYGNEPDDVIYSVLQYLVDEYNLGENIDDWKRMVSLKSNAYHISDRVLFNFHTGELVGFTEDTFYVDI